MHTKLFVYGSLKAGLFNNRLLDGCKFLGTFKTADSTYTMLDLGLFPAVIDRGTDAIEGELYVVDPMTMELCDRLESNGTFYEREQVLLENGVAAWMYLFLRERPEHLTNRVQSINGVASWSEKAVNWEDYVRLLR